MNPSQHDTHSLQALRDSLAGDPHRPAYHFVAPANWLNDPNGLIQWQGQFHLFYQYNPAGPFHGTIHWGHAVSDDLVHWRDLPVALTPEEGKFDQDGCWSGCALDNDGVPTFFYSGVFPQVVNIATSQDDLLTWDKFEGNPVIPGPPEDLHVASGGDFRDPFVWRDGEAWSMLMGSREEGRSGLVLLYRSADLINWTYEGVLLAGDVQQQDPFWPGTVWECPNLFPVEDQDVLLISIQENKQQLLYVVYYQGIYSRQRFIPDRSGILVHGGSFYAPQVMMDEQGRRLMWGWLQEGRNAAACLEAGWTGVMSLPIQFHLNDDDDLCLAPAPEMIALRRNHRHFGLQHLPDGADLRLDGIAGDALEIIAEFEVPATGEFGLKLRATPDDQEYTRLMVQTDAQEIAVKRDHSSLSYEVNRDILPAPVTLTPGATLRLHIFLDRSVIEVFINDGIRTIASRIYPTRPDSLGVSLYSRGGEVQLISMDVWEMASIW